LQRLSTNEEGVIEIQNDEDDDVAPHSKGVQQPKEKNNEVQTPVIRFQNDNKTTTSIAKMTAMTTMLCLLHSFIESEVVIIVMPVRDICR
jgi:hypothetical protein